MNNQKGNQPNKPANDQDLSNKNIDSLKEFNSTPIDTPTPMPLSDNLDPSKSLSEESLTIENPKSQPISEPEVPTEPSAESLLEPETELKSTSEINPESKTELDQETEVIPMSEVEPQPNADLASNQQPEIQPQPEPEVELKSEPDIEPKLDTEDTPDLVPKTQAETEPPSPITEDPEIVKQKIEEVLSYNSANSVVNSKSDKPKPSNLLKTLFALSLIVFIAVAVGLAYFILNPSLKTNPETKVVPPTAPVQSNITCELNGFIYTLNQSFPSADGCNTCTCVSVDNIECTEKICGDVTTTPPATTSANFSDAFKVSKRSPQGVEVGDESGINLVSSPLKAISITFNNQIDPTTITNNTFYVLDGIDSKVTGKISYNNSSKTAILTFTNPITNTDLNNIMRVTVLVKNIKDINNNLIESLTYNIDIKN